MRKQIFRHIDSLLPRWLAMAPYALAILVIRGVVRLSLGGKVWNRNSTRTQSFIFGVSDLDLTVMTTGGCSLSFLNQILRLMKKIFIFLGETNHYEKIHLPFILERINSFELSRDPELSTYFEGQKSHDEIEKIIFIQRMLFADVHSLRKDPELRQLKWRSHFKLLGIEFDEGIITLEVIVKKLKELHGFDQKISEGLDAWLREVLKPRFNVFTANLGDGFKILAPHAYLWFHDNSEADKRFLESLTITEKKIIQRQIDWELWGLYCQRFQLDFESVRIHMGRLQKVYRLITSQAESLKLEDEIKQTLKI